MVRIVIDPSCCKSKGGGASYDDTAILERLAKLENRTDNFVDNVLVSREGNKVKFKYTRVDGTSNEVEFEDKDTITMAYDDSALRARIEDLEIKPDKDTVYDDTALKQRVDALENKVDNDTVYDDTEVKNRLTALEAKEDKDTIYDDSALKARVEALEAKPEVQPYNDKPLADRVTALESKEDNDKQTLTLTGNELSISNGNSVNLPEVELKTYEVTSDTEGVVVTKTEADNTVTHNVNMDTALNKFYKKAETYTKNEVDNLIEKQEAKATDITVYRGTFTDKTKVKEGANDVDVSPRITLTYSSSTGVGILKVDLMIVAGVGQGTIIATLPNNAPVPATLIESQVWVGNAQTSIWVDPNSRSIRMYNTTDPSIFNKRMIINIPGIFKKI